MIKFFRHIRKTLIQENKMGKYFKYAIGEILLVMIGILLALQVSNWNSSRKQSLLKQTYINRLINDLQQDTTNINSVTKTITDNQQIIKNLITTIDQENNFKTLDTVLTKYFEKGWLIYEFIPTSNTYTDLSQTGNMNIIDNTDLIDAIIRYYGFLKEIENYNNVNKNWITPLDQEVAILTPAFEIDPITSNLFKHKSRTEAITKILTNRELIERNAAGHHWINESLVNNLKIIKDLSIDLLESLNKEQTN